jgi:HPr kinase/phosphorylase
VETQVHGALIDVLGVGVMLLGPSGIGKSECALELVQRGHRLVADDVVRVRCGRDEQGRDRPIGRAPELIRHYMELRGIGLLYVPELYGDEAVCAEAHVDLLCHLEHWREEAEYERVGIDRPMEELVGCRVPSLTLPVRPAGGSLATLVEVACRDELQRRVGVNAARRLDERLSRQEGKQGS